MKLYDHWQGDRKHYINEVKKHAQELNEILQSENTYSIHDSDEAWNITCLHEEIIQISKKGSPK